MIVKQANKAVRRKRAFLAITVKHCREGHGKEEEGDIFILDHLALSFNEITILLEGILRNLLVHLLDQLSFVVLSMKFIYSKYFSHRSINIQIIAEQGKDTVVLWAHLSHSLPT